jgi:hypothetical protein
MSNPVWQVNAAGWPGSSDIRFVELTSLPAVRTAPYAEQNHQYFNLERALLPPHLIIAMHW